MKLSVEQFNESFPVGTAVKYYPVKGDNTFQKTSTRSAAWELGHGEVVVSVNGVTGCVSIDHLEVSMFIEDATPLPDEPSLEITRQEPELTLSALLTQRCTAFANSPRAVEIIDKGVEGLFKSVVEDAFGSYSEFGKTVKTAFKAALPGHVDKIIELERYNSMVVRLMQERWAGSSIGSDLVEKMTDMVNEFVSEEKTPKIILASDLWAAFIADHKESACQNNWDRPQVIIEESSDGFIRVGLESDEGSSYSRKNTVHSCDVYLGFHQQFDRDGHKNTPIQHEGNDVYELYTGALKNGQVLGKKIIKGYTKFDKLVLALYYGGSLLAWDESPEDLYYPGFD